VNPEIDIDASGNASGGNSLATDTPKSGYLQVIGQSSAVQERAGQV
jgi:hypothetical protein